MYVCMQPYVHNINLMIINYLEYNISTPQCDTYYDQSLTPDQSVFSAQGMLLYSYVYVKQLNDTSGKLDNESWDFVHTNPHLLFVCFIGC